MVQSHLPIAGLIQWSNIKDNEFRSLAFFKKLQPVWFLENDQDLLLALLIMFPLGLL